MNNWKLLTMSAAVGVALCVAGLWANAEGLGDGSRTSTTTYTVPTGGTLTITNQLQHSSSTEWWTAIEVSHVDPLTNNVFTVTRTRDSGHGFTMWSSTHTNDSIAIEFASKRAIITGDVIVFKNTVTGAITKVYVTKQIQ